MWHAGSSAPSSRAHPPQFPTGGAQPGDGGLGLLGNAAAVASGPPPSQPALELAAPGVFSLPAACHLPLPSL